MVTHTFRLKLGEFDEYHDLDYDVMVEGTLLSYKNYYNQNILIDSEEISFNIFIYNANGIIIAFPSLHCLYSEDMSENDLGILTSTFTISSWDTKYFVNFNAIGTADGYSRLVSIELNECP